MMDPRIFTNLDDLKHQYPEGTLTSTHSLSYDRDYTSRIPGWRRTKNITSATMVEVDRTLMDFVEEHFQTDDQVAYIRARSDYPIETGRLGIFNRRSYAMVHTAAVIEYYAKN